MRCGRQCFAEASASDGELIEGMPGGGQVK